MIGAGILVPDIHTADQGTKTPSSLCHTPLCLWIWIFLKLHHSQMQIP